MDHFEGLDGLVVGEGSGGWLRQHAEPGKEGVEVLRPVLQRGACCWAGGGERKNKMQEMVKRPMVV